MISQLKISCRTCKSSHVKEYEFPCRDCCNFEQWEFAEKDPWPMFPMKSDPWGAVNGNTKEAQ